MLFGNNHQAFDEMKNQLLLFDVQEVHIFVFQITFLTNAFKDLIAYTEKARL